MLDYLVASKVRRRLLKLLWADRFSGSVSELARLAAVGFASAHAELRQMEEAGLACSRREDNTLVYSAQMKHPRSRQLEDLFRSEFGSHGVWHEAGDLTKRDILLNLVAWGAPLGLSGTPRVRLSCESTVARALGSAHRNATVARVLPIALFRNRERLDLNRLAFLADRSGEARALGFFLDLTAELSGDHRFRRFAHRLRDRRVTRARDFFVAKGGRFARILAEANTPAVAKRWHFRMNMGLDSFESLFRKFVEGMA